MPTTISFHQNVGEGKKSFTMSPDPAYLSEAFGKGFGCARLVQCNVPRHPPLQSKAFGKGCGSARLGIYRVNLANDLQHNVMRK